MKTYPSKARKKPAKRPLGFYRGQIWMAPDFDAPMEFIETSEGMELVPETASSVKKKGKGRKSTKSLRP
jgi:hypothetical protein